MLRIHTAQTIHEDMRDDDVDGMRLEICRLNRKLSESDQHINRLITENGQLRLQLSVAKLRGQYAAATFGRSQEAEATSVTTEAECAAR